MKLREIYELAIKLGTEVDPRGPEGISRYFEDAKKELEGLKGLEKDAFDREKLVNPFADTRILNGDPDLEVRNIIAGIDVEGPELILVDRLREKGMEIDLAVGHHPEGRALVGLYEVMKIQPDVWADAGLSPSVGDRIITDRMSEVRRSLLPANHQRPIDTARLLGIPFMCVHTPADNLVTAYLMEKVAKNKPLLIGDVIEMLLEEPEYRASAMRGVPPMVLVGDKKSRAGRVIVDMTGGTQGPAKSIGYLVRAGVGTVVAMHMSDKLKETAEKENLNVIIAGHMASDSIGLNRFLDQVEKNGVTCKAFSGFERVSRN